MNILCLGINHRTAPIEIRERLWFSTEEIKSFLPAFRAAYAHECVLVSTCNRTELYFVGRNAESENGDLWKHLATQKQSLDAAREENFYLLHGANAVKHLYNVASGIDSMVLGDVQILGQIKDSLAIAQSERTIGSLLSRLFTTALHVGKRAKTETEISEGAVSVSYAAAELASKIFQDLGRRTALLIGAGETGKLTARHLSARNVGKLLVTNRTRENAESLAKSLGGTVVDFSGLRQTLIEADIVISSVNVTSHVLDAEDVRTVMKNRDNRPLFIIDIGVPRNIDPESNRIGNVFLHDIDALNAVVDRNIAHRRAEIPKVEHIVINEVIAFEQWHKSLDLGPTIQDLRDQFERIRSTEIEKHVHQLSPEHREVVELLTKRIINKILHTPLVNLRNGNTEGISHDTRSKIDLVRHLFGLDRNHTE